VNNNNYLNGIFPSFDSLNNEFSPSFRLIDNYSSYFSFYQANCKDKESKATHLCKLNNIFTKTLSNPNTIIVVSDTSIRNNIAISISHIHSYSNNIKKTIYHAVNITLTEAELFSIKCKINQAVQFLCTTYIIVITDTIYSVQCVFDSIVYLYQLQSITIVKDLRTFFNKNLINSIKFWNYPSNNK